MHSILVKNSNSSRYAFMLLVASLPMQMSAASLSKSNTYVSGEVGYSSSRHADFSVASPGTGYTNPTRDITGPFGHSVAYGVALGYYFMPMFRAEVAYNIRPNFEYNQTRSDPATDRQRDFDINNQTAMFSAYLNILDLNVFEKIHLGPWDPYVGVGIGSSWNKTGQLNATTVSTGEVRANPIAGDETTNFSWQLMAGTLFDVKNNLSLEVGYRYVNIGRIAVSNHYTNQVDRPQLISVLSASSAAVQDIFAGLHYRFA
ncbi:MAG: outer membrane beta-barrel protein [Legionellaceae bacterium]|nr:outer membrane beta-barrel protein [Legionellaceae bacterium]